MLGHFALAGALLTTLAAASGRMVWLGSMSTSMWKYDPVDPQLVEDYTGWRAYVQSKVATAALGFEADRRLRAAGVPVTSVVAHPGIRRAAARPASSASTTRAGSRGSPTTCSSRSRSPRSTARGRSCARSSTPTSRAASSGARDGVASGEPRGQGVEDHPQPEIAERLWGVCEDATGVRWPFRRGARVAAGRGSAGASAGRLTQEVACRQPSSLWARSASRSTSLWAIDANDGIIATAGLLQGFAGAGAGAPLLLFASTTAMIAGGLSAGGAKWAEVAAEREAQLDARPRKSTPSSRANRSASSPSSPRTGKAAASRPRSRSEVADQLIAHDALAAPLDAEHGHRRDHARCGPVAAGRRDRRRLHGSALPFQC